MGKPSAKRKIGFTIADGIYQNFPLRNSDKNITPPSVFSAALR